MRSSVMPTGRGALAAVLVALLFPAGAQALNPQPKWFSYDRPANYVAEIDHTLMVPMRAREAPRGFHKAGGSLAF